MPSLCKHHLDTADAKRPKHHLDTSRKPPKPQAKKLFHITFGIHIKQSLEPQSTCANTSLCKHHLDTADAKRPKHHLDTSRKPPKPQAKKLFHITFGIHIKQSLEPQSTCPAYANTSLCKHHLDTADAKRPKHHLDTSRKPPKPQAKKLFHITFGIHIKQSLEPQSTCANTSLCKHHLDTADAKRPKHHLDTSRKPPKPQAKKLFHVTFGIRIKQSLEPQSTCANTSLCKHHLDTADAKRPKHHHVTFGIHTTLEPKCPAYAQTPSHKNCWSHRAPLESYANNHLEPQSTI